MNKTQRIIMLIVAAVVLLMLLFPPMVLEMPNGMSFPEGYNFIAFFGELSSNSLQLLVQIVAVAIVGGFAALAFKDKKITATSEQD